MKAKFYANQLKIEGIARKYIQQVKGARSRPTKGMDESHRGEARDILEDIREQDNAEYELDIDIKGRTLIDQMDRDFEDMGLVPYFFSDAARAAGEGISVGSRVNIPCDERQFRIVSVSRRCGAVRLRDAEGNEYYVVPWQLVRPWRD